MLALAPGLARAGKGRSLTVDRSPNPDVLEVVPWSYGFAHSWTWKWLLEQKELAPFVLSAVEPLLRVGAIGIDNLRREVPVGGSRADLAFSTFAPDGTRSLSPSKPRSAIL